MKKANLVVFASGGKEGGGSGFQKLVEAAKTGVLQVNIVAVVSNHAKGGVYEKANRLNIPFIHFPGPFEAEFYQGIVQEAKADFVAFSGWLKLVKGLDPRTTFNIHPGPLPHFGGPGLYGHHVHEAVLKAFQEKQLTYSEVSMHFVTEEYDKGPVFFRCPVPIKSTDTADDLGTRVNQAEHAYQPYATNLVVTGKIKWDGINPESLIVPDGYEGHQRGW